MLFTAFLLGLIEGATEFLPVSSTGHLILLVDILNFQGPPGKVFEIVIQLGAILAVCCLYWRKLLSMATGLLGRKEEDMRFTAGILLAFLPAMVAGALFHEVIKGVLFNPFNVSLALVTGGVAILLIERYKPEARHHQMEAMPLSLYLKIGLCQCLALVPGTSRSGATIMGALLLGVDRRVATEFSFFLAIPTMVAATVFNLYESWDGLTGEGWQLIAVGFFTAFVSALAVVRGVIIYISRHGFRPFAWYRIVLGSVMLYLLW